MIKMNHLKTLTNKLLKAYLQVLLAWETRYISGSRRLFRPQGKSKKGTLEYTCFTSCSLLGFFTSLNVPLVDRNKIVKWKQLAKHAKMVTCPPKNRTLSFSFFIFLVNVWLAKCRPTDSAWSKLSTVSGRVNIPGASYSYALQQKREIQSLNGNAEIQNVLVKKAIINKYNQKYRTWNKASEI